ncbi:MAG: hypothetical protein DRI34_07415 [Deltaproteobacteria bacterium]|nr:MAG: hypothetical protein DRI34_07415 [Deltaproteobacteria bacterium]
MTEQVRSLTVQVVDVFSVRLLSGCPVAVFSGAGELSEGECLHLAAELGMPVSVFAAAGREADGQWRQFSPRQPLELSLTGLLAAAAATRAPVTFPGGTARSEPAGDDTGPVRLELELSGVEFAPYRYSRDLLAGTLGLDRYRMPDHWPLEQVRAGSPSLVVPVATVDALAEIRPDYDSLARLNRKIGVVRTVLYTWQGAAELRLRTLAPALGIFEQPGSAAAVGAAAALVVKEKALTLSPPRSELSAAQGVEVGRASHVELAVEHDAREVKKVHLTTSAVLSLRGDQPRAVTPPRKEQDPPG